ncbi:hypothetical protein WA026_019905 [Henosepilachna vigintioctopunctata]|uniref:HAT C-terminal dimerisation domain-containing protein n=1 Tax=Henosepilachna vigintioctopunctata TaxID=420089 RepID=A0AAW1VFD5_9CUCU
MTPHLELCNLEITQDQNFKRNLFSEGAATKFLNQLKREEAEIIKKDQLVGLAIRDKNNIYKLLIRVKPANNEVIIVTTGILKEWHERLDVRGADILTFDHTNPSKHVKLSDLYLGVLAQQSVLALKSDKNVQENELDHLFISCKKIYVQLVTEIKKRFIFSDPIFDIVSIVDPKVAQEYRVKSLTHILSRFPFLRTHVYSQELDNEWRQHALLDYTTHNIDVNNPADVYWGKVFSLKNNMNIQILIVLPFANASVERVFSSLNLIKSYPRNKLETSTLRSIFHTKEGVLSNGGILKFEPTKEMYSNSIWKS